MSIVSPLSCRMIWVSSRFSKCYSASCRFCSCGTLTLSSGGGCRARWGVFAGGRSIRLGGSHSPCSRGVIPIPAQPGDTPPSSPPFLHVFDASPIHKPFTNAPPPTSANSTRGKQDLGWGFVDEVYSSCFVSGRSRRRCKGWGGVFGHDAQEAWLCAGGKAKGIIRRGNACFTRYGTIVLCTRLGFGRSCCVRLVFRINLPLCVARWRHLEGVLFGEVWSSL